MRINLEQLVCGRCGAPLAAGGARPEQVMPCARCLRIAALEGAIAAMGEALAGAGVPYTTRGSDNTERGVAHVL